MTTLEDYRSRYAHVRFDRDGDGIMVMTLHTDGGSMQWGAGPHGELAGALHDVGRDRANKVVILTGAGDVFVGPKASKATRFYTARPEGDVWEAAISEDFHIVMNHVNIEVPVIAAVNGPAFRRSELALLADIVLCTPDASFEDSHFAHSELVPGDGLGLIIMDLLGANRGRYHLLTGAPVPAQQALALGLVAEIVERDALLARAHDIARAIAAKPPLVVRGTRAAITQRLKRLLASELHSGMFIEGFSGMAKDY